MNNTSKLRTTLNVAFVAAFSRVLVEFGSTVAGSTYIDNGGAVQIEWTSDGKADVSTGPVTTTCSYTQSGKTLTLMSRGDKTTFTVEDDGALSGPPDGFMGRLTKKK